MPIGLILKIVYLHLYPVHSNFQYDGSLLGFACVVTYMYVDYCPSHEIERPLKVPIVNVHKDNIRASISSSEYKGQLKI